MCILRILLCLIYTNIYFCEAASQVDMLAYTFDLLWHHMSGGV